MSDIVKIVRYMDRGMYRDSYDVQYKKENGSFFWKTYTIRGEMFRKHFDFILAYPVIAVYSPFTGAHIMDIWKCR